MIIGLAMLVVGIYGYIVYEFINAPSIDENGNIIEKNKKN